MSETHETAEPYKSSAEILSELFSSFNAEPPLTFVDEKATKKHKKSKKKHKHKEKKHKKKSKKHSHSSESSDNDSSSSESKHKHKSKKKSKNNQTVTEKLEKWGIDFDLNKVKTEAEVEPILSAIKKETEIEKNETNKKVEEPELEKNNETDKSNKIQIKDLKNSTTYEAAIKEIEQKAIEKASKFEEGELTESEDLSVDLEDSSLTDIQIKSSESNSSKSERKRKHSHRDKSRDRESEKKRKTNVTESDSSKRCSKKSTTKSHSHKTHRSRSKDKDKEKEKSTSSSRRDYDYNSHNHNKNNDYRHYDDYYANSRSYFSNDRDRDRDRYNKYDRDKRSRSRSKDRFSSRSKIRDHRDHRKRRSSSPSSSIDKKKLLEIARKNAINMLKSGTLPEALTLGPQAQEKVIAAIKAGGKTIEELTDFCKNLSKKEELGELSSVSSNEDEDDSENEKVFHHPFQLKEKPSSIVMNIKNATPLPVKTSKEKSAELRMQFPVSSGQLHRKNEGEWIPVSPKKPDPPLAIMPPPPPPPPVVAVVKPPPAFVKASTQPATLSTVPAQVQVPVVPEIVPEEVDPENTIAALATPQSDVDISTIVSQRLNAMRRLQENPNDVQALGQMYKVQKEMSAWAQSKQQPGQFTGSTGAQILTPAELSSGYQAWARKVN